MVIRPPTLLIACCIILLSSLSLHGLGYWQLLNKAALKVQTAYITCARLAKNNARPIASGSIFLVSCSMSCACYAERAGLPSDTDPTLSSKLSELTVASALISVAAYTDLCMHINSNIVSWLQKRRSITSTDKRHD